MKAKKLILSTVLLSSLAVLTNVAQAQAGDTAFERYGVRLNTSSSLTTEQYLAKMAKNKEVVKTDLPTFENTKTSEIRLPYYYNSSTSSGRYGVYENKNDIVITTYATSEGNYVTKGHVAYANSYSIDNEGRKVYNFTDGRQLKEETTDFAKKQYLGAIKASDDVVYRYWK